MPVTISNSMFAAQNELVVWPTSPDQIEGLHLLASMKQRTHQAFNEHPYPSSSSSFSYSYSRSLMPNRYFHCSSAYCRLSLERTAADNRRKIKPKVFRSPTQPLQEVDGSFYIAVRVLLAPVSGGLGLGSGSECDRWPDQRLWPLIVRVLGLSTSDLPTTLCPGIHR